MASIILGQVGSAIGSSFGGAALGGIGLGLGEYLGRQLDSSILGNSPTTRINGTRIADLSVQTSTYGKMIPIIYGTVRIAGNIIWSTPIKENSQINSSGGGKFGGPKVIRTNYHYSVSLAIALGEGPIDSIIKVWADNRLIDPNDGTYRIYKGTENQLPDPLIEANQGLGMTPAFRGLAYLVIEDFPLAEFGNRIPNFTFEVKRKVSHKNLQSNNLPVEDMINSMVIIPGSGEFVYDTKIQKKVTGQQIEGTWISNSKETKINLNNRENKADALVSLDQLQNTCPNVNWVAPVVGWFASSQDVSSITIKPGVEYSNDNTKTIPDQWKVANFTRNTAHQITKDKNNSPIYGGTISDNSILRFLDELKNRNYNIMFYPMFFIDQINKPWRGRVTGNSDDIKKFFNQPNGYNKFILHYASLVKDKVDAFIIGSELIGLTKVKDRNNNFPAVEELINLAKQVKKIVGDKVKISYAADWSEYHHTEGGWYNLDKLWASEAIDFIGIDAYFPLTELTNNYYDEQEVIKGWQSGEGYDYYFEDGKKNLKRPLSKEWAWKNIKWWWENNHYNPDGKKTDWQPKSKKIWFTEYGFPSVDLASNQPNVFYDPKSSESSFPINSRGKVDFYAQRISLTATEKYWQNSDIVERKFVWAWDARPYPYWPDFTAIWADGGNWSRGHWVNGKLGSVTLSSVIAELCSKAGLEYNDFNVDELKDIVDGYAIVNQCTIRAAIETLQQAYFFDITEKDGILKFLNHQKKTIHKITVNDMTNDGKVQITRLQEFDLPKKFELIYIDKINNYQQAIASSIKDTASYNNSEVLNLPIVINESKAKMIADIAIRSKWLARHVYNFTLLPKYSYLQVGDIVEIINYDKTSFIAKIVALDFGQGRCIKISAIEEDQAVYENNVEQVNKVNKLAEIKKDPGDSKFFILDLPNLPWEKDSDLGLYVAAFGTDEDWRGASIIGPNNTTRTVINNTVGVISSTIRSTNCFVFDKVNKIEVQLFSGELNGCSLEDCLNWHNLALVNEELIQFTKVNHLGNNRYQLSNILRGRLGTENKVKQHQVGSNFILIDKTLEKFDLSLKDIGKNIDFRVTSIGHNFSKAISYQHLFKAASLKPYPILDIKRHKNKITWQRRSRVPQDWRSFVDVTLDERTEQYLIKIYKDGKELTNIISDKAQLDISDYIGCDFIVKQLSELYIVN